MSATVMVAIPLALLGVVALLGFVGCLLNTHGYGDYFQYQTTVIDTAGLVAFWPLAEQSGTNAVDASNNNFNGTYVTRPAVPYDAASLSAAATGAVNIGQPGIVPGDTLSDNASQRTTCPFFDGGFVSVPFHAEINMPPPFTVEAWVKPTWTDQDVQNEPAVRGVVMSINTPNNTGFGLFVTQDNFWGLVFGDGSKLISITPPAGSNQKIMLNTTSHLVMTYDGTTATLFVNDADGTPYAQGPVSNYVPMPSGTPLYIGTARPDLPPPPVPGFPFKGFIQDVAIYNKVLDQATIQTHFMNGNAMTKTS